MVETGKKLGIIVTGFIAVLLGIILIQVIADNIAATDDIQNSVNESIDITTTLNTVVNESITLTAGLGQTANAGITGISDFGNGSYNTNTDQLTINTHVNSTRQGQIIANTTDTPSGVYNISYTYATNGIGNVDITEDITSLNYFGNTTMSTDEPGVILNTDANISSVGLVRVSTLNFSAGPYNASYTYEDEFFVSNATARTLLKLIPIFFVIAILFLAVMLAKRMMPELFG